MSDEKSPLDVLLDVMVFGPIGFAADAHRLVPELAAKGRETVDAQVRLARMIGRFAVQQGQKELVKVLGLLGQTPPRRANPASGSHGPAANGDVAEAGVADEVIPVRVEMAEPRPSVRSDLAIADYDSLAASHVLPLLDSLSPAELEAVRAHESTHRKRKTILGRIAQIESQ